MAIFESKFNVGDKVFKRSRVIAWANGEISSLVPFAITKAEIKTEGEQKTKVFYRTKNGDYIDECAAVAEKDVKSIAIAHLSSRLSAVAAADSPADQQVN